MKVTRKLAPVALMLLLVGACSANARETALTRTLDSLNAAHAGFVEFDKDHQNRIVEQAENYEDGAADLARYRVRREPVLRAFVVAYSAVAAAAIDFEGEGLINQAVQALTDLYFAVDALKESL